MAVLVDPGAATRAYLVQTQLVAFLRFGGTMKIIAVIAARQEPELPWDA